MEGPISKFMHVQQPESYWHQPSSSNAFKSPDLIELNSDTERSAKTNVEPLNYSSSQEETDDGCDSTDVIHLKEAVPGVYDVTSNDEESCHLLQTEDDSESSRGGSSRSSSSNGATISDGEEERNHRGSRVKHPPHENYWDMSPEQEKYYTDQFLSLQSDLSGLVKGVVAKGFFEKSKLPLSELREIWQLADVTKDGCLDLIEFKMAMHLVVLRRHGLPIPSHFYVRPPDFSLRHSPSGPSSLFKISAPHPKSTTTSKTRSNEPNPGTSSHQSPLATAIGSNDFSKSQVTPGKRPSKEWTTFENEPVNFSSTCDTSGLVAPVPVRLKTPEDKLILSTTPSASASKTHQLQLKAIQRPKLSGHHPKVSGGTIAPPPPPRRKTHVRSSSLDLNRLTISTEIPPNMCGVRVGGGGEVVTSRSFLSPCHQGGAFVSVYRKPQLPKAATIHEPSDIPNNSPPSTIASSSSTNAMTQFEQEVDDLKNENELLSRISAQLLDQLAGLQSRRQSVAYKLHQLQSNLS
ncbi:ralBP1-associated Eps domain-containing protein 2 isoform X2 [Folsomia candida]|uniref:ralBP1-associated Eps domain-containing protein 2 isoform X2 n=1 Tax=Folsomia candida TaxID=158441 RepID=UPI000B904E35|nr:ralBP1-associated Eps domain-containing protein 2 isoform X2 [Folsomia candida]